MSIERCAVDVNAARPHRSDRLRLHQVVLAVVFRKLVRPRHGLHLPLALLVSDFVSQRLMRRYKRHWSEHPLVGQFHVDGDVNLVSAAVLFVRPENFVELPLEVTLVRVGGQIPTRAHSSGCARIEAQDADCLGAQLVLPCELSQRPYELFPCLLRCE